MNISIDQSRMRRWRQLGRWGLLPGLCCLTLSAFADKAMPRGAFLRQPAKSVQAIQTALAEDPIVRTRYARIFHLSPQMLRAAFLHLHLERLSKDCILQVHYVHPGEEIGYRWRRVRKGTLIYALADGTPLLAQVCGNPLRAGLFLTFAPPLYGSVPYIPDFDQGEPQPPPTATQRPAMPPLRGAAPIILQLASTLPADRAAPGPPAPRPMSAAFAAVMGLWPTEWVSSYVDRVSRNSLSQWLRGHPIPLSWWSSGPWTEAATNDFIPSPDAAPAGSVLPVPADLTSAQISQVATRSIRQWAQQGEAYSPPTEGLPDQSAPGSSLPFAESVASMRASLPSTPWSSPWVAKDQPFTLSESTTPEKAESALELVPEPDVLTLLAGLGMAAIGLLRHQSRRLAKNAR